MGVEQIIGIDGLAADLGVEVQAACGEAASFQNLQHRQRDFRHVDDELVRVPSRLIVAAVHVDGTENAKCRSKRDFMLEGVACENGVVLLDVDLHILLRRVKRSANRLWRRHSHIGAWSVPVASAQS